MAENDVVHDKDWVEGPIDVLNGTAVWDRDKKGNTTITMKPGQSEPRPI